MIGTQYASLCFVNITGLTMKIRCITRNRRQQFLNFQAYGRENDAKQRKKNVFNSNQFSPNNTQNTRIVRHKSSEIEKLFSFVNEMTNSKRLIKMRTKKISVWNRTKMKTTGSTNTQWMTNADNVDNLNWIKRNCLLCR